MIISQSSKAPILLIHGGVNTLEGAVRDPARQDILRRVIVECRNDLAAGGSALDAVCKVTELLEADPHFNAGRGSYLQSDGLARLSSALMDGEREKFSAVALVTNLIHPSKLARALQDRQDTVLGPYGAQLLARELGLPCENPATLEQLEKLVDHHKKAISAAAADARRGGTVGAVALDSKGRLAACTSTGGVSQNFPERMSDSSTVAGNYATRHAAVSCTGIGEQIMNQGLAVRLETRVRDGSTMKQASEKLLEEVRPLTQRFAWIGLDRNGIWSIAKTTGIIYAAAIGAGDASPIIADADEQ